jgi:hypothetical protein
MLLVKLTERLKTVFDKYTILILLAQNQFDINRQKITLEDQLSYAVYADILIGLHGAALVHGVFFLTFTNETKQNRI